MTKQEYIYVITVLFLTLVTCITVSITGVDSFPVQVLTVLVFVALFNGRYLIGLVFEYLKPWKYMNQENVLEKNKDQETKTLKI